MAQDEGSDQIKTQIQGYRPCLWQQEMGPNSESVVGADVRAQEPCPQIDQEDITDPVANPETGCVPKKDVDRYGQQKDQQIGGVYPQRPFQVKAPRIPWSGRKKLMTFAQHMGDEVAAEDKKSGYRKGAFPDRREMADTNAGKQVGKDVIPVSSVVLIDDHEGQQEAQDTEAHTSEELYSRQADFISGYAGPLLLSPDAAEEPAAHNSRQLDCRRQAHFATTDASARRLPRGRWPRCCRLF